MPLNFFQKMKSDSSSKLSEESKFLQWTEIDKANVMQLEVDLKIDENEYILYWRARNKKSDFLDIALIRDVRNGKYANVPKDKNVKDVLLSGQSDVPIEDKTISIYYGSDFANIKCINFVSLAHSGSKVAKELTEKLFKIAKSPKTQNLSPFEQIKKLRSILLHGKAVFDEKSKEFQLPIQTLVECFFPNEKQRSENERRDFYTTLKSLGLPSDKDDVINEKKLTTDVFLQLFSQLISKSITNSLADYGSITKGKLTMNCEQLENFINEKQRDSRLNEILFPYVKHDQVKALIKKFDVDSDYRKKDVLSILGLIHYLMDAESEIVDLKKYELYEDMRQPMSHYFINSSHNTYLTGHQLTGKSDVEIYRQVLLSGCRCIELDCWDDEDLVEPIITHGRTLVSKILFKDVIEAIKESAFKTSPYPVLLSFENHCCEKLQKKMASYLHEIFGDMLLSDPLPEHPLNPGVPLPSPEDLKYKILVKNRKDTQNTNDSLKIKKTESSPFEPEMIKEPSSSKPSLNYQVSTNEDTSDNENENESNAKEMSNLVNYLQPVKLKSFEHAEKLNRAYELSSLPETKAYNLIKENALEFVNFNKRSFSRIYPKGTRISSDNYMPQVYWNVGCQLVALNFQTLDVPMQLNQGKFSYNNSCGYLLKPEEMRRIGVNQSYDPFSIKPLPQIQAQTATVQILSGFCLLDRRKAYTITVEMFGLPADTRKGQRAFKTRLQNNNYFNVIYHENVFKFPRIIMPSLALLRFCAYDEQSKLIGHRVIPLNDLRSGFRFICLKNESYQPLNACMIFVNINVREYVAEEHQDFVCALTNPGEHISSLDRNIEPIDDSEDGLNDLSDLSIIEKHEKMLQRLTEDVPVIEEITHL